MSEQFAPAAAAGIHRIAIPTPFAVGRVNVYLIEDEPLTLVDAGPNSGASLDELERGLRALGHALESIELILLTHQHIDHLGLVGIVARRSGAEVAAIEAAVPYVQDYPRAARAEDEFAAEVMLRHGIAEDVVRALRVVSEAFHGWGASASVSRVLRDADRIDLCNRSFEVAFRPGHSPSDTVFLDRERGILLAADHLLKNISSNPLIVSDPDGGGRLPSLLLYLDSLRLTREMEAQLVLPGHGDPVTDHKALIGQRLEAHERRAEDIGALIAERPRTAHEIAQAIWGDIAVTQAYLTLSEVLGHTDLLLQRGSVREVQDGPVVRFETV